MTRRIAERDRETERQRDREREIYKTYLLVLELLGNILCRSTRDVDPGLGEESTSGQDERDVEESMERIVEDLGQVVWWRDIVRKTTGGDGLDRASGASNILPSANEIDQDETTETTPQELRKEVQVGYKSSLEDDGDIGGVEELDRVGLRCTTDRLVLDVEIDAEALEEDDDDEHKAGGQEVGDVGEVLAVESLLESTHFVSTSEQEVEQGNECTLELGTTALVEGLRAECLPDDGLADVGGDEERNARAQTIALLQHLVLVVGKAKQSKAKQKQKQFGVSVGWRCKCVNVVDQSNVYIRGTKQ
jgi:hypothetical protein